jgi:hypothetical protein
MREIETLHDLVELGIKLSKQDLPNGFICTVWTKKENREKIRMSEKNKNAKRRNSIGYSKITLKDWNLLIN